MNWGRLSQRYPWVNCDDDQNKNCDDEQSTEELWWWSELKLWRWTKQRSSYLPSLKCYSRVLCHLGAQSQVAKKWNKSDINIQSVNNSVLIKFILWVLFVTVRTSKSLSNLFHGFKFCLENKRRFLIKFILCALYIKKLSNVLITMILVLIIPLVSALVVQCSLS